MMKSGTWLVALTAIMIAVLVSTVDLSFAEKRGRGMGRCGQGTQSWTRSWGSGNPNCPYYPGYRNCPQGWASNPQARRGRRWNQAVNPPAPQSVVPELTQ